MKRLLIVSIFCIQVSMTSVSAQEQPPPGHPPQLDEETLKKATMSCKQMQGFDQVEGIPQLCKVEPVSLKKDCRNEKR